MFFYSPSGIIIGSNATIDVGALGLTSAEPLTDGSGNFIVNDQVQFQQAVSGSSITIDDGAQIAAVNEGSYVAMFAPRVEHLGDVTVNGSAALVAGEAGTITFSPDGLFDIQVTVGTDAGNGIEVAGSITGPGSTSQFDNHHAYLVAIPKNTAVSIAINGGSNLGFDIANSAFVDGNAVVLSAGHSIDTGGIDVGPAPAGGGNGGIINLSDADFGFGGGLTFGAQVEARAITEIFANLSNDVVFNASAAFFGGSIFFQLGTDGVRSANLITDGDFSLTGEAPAFGADTGAASFNVNDGAVATVGGNLRVATQASTDANNDGFVEANTANVALGGVGQLTVLGDLEVESRVDLLGVSGLPAARSGSVALTADFGSIVDVTGATRLRSSVRAPIGVDAQSAFAELQLFNGSQVTTGELSISSSALGGDDTGSGGGNAQSGQATILVNNTGTSLTVLNPSTNFDSLLSSTALGGIGTAGVGGDAATGTVSINVSDDGTISLPNNAGNPLVIENFADGGGTSANGRAAGSASVGPINIVVNDSTVDLGLLNIASNAVGGSADGAAQFVRGGDAGALGTPVFVNFVNSTVDVAFEGILVDIVGGDGSGEEFADGGSATSGQLIFAALDSNVNILSGLDIRAFATGGFGSRGGAAQAASISVGIDQSELSIDGDLRLLAEALGGASAAGFIFDPITGDPIETPAGDASVLFSEIRLFETNATISGAVVGSVTATGGDASVTGGRGGNATTGSLNATLTGNIAFDAASVSLSNSATGGSSVSPGQIGQGGDATVGEAVFRLFENGNAQPRPGGPTEATLTITGDITLQSTAQGGTGGAEVITANGPLFGRGGNASGALANISVTNPGSLAVGGSVTLTKSAIGGNAPGGLGGNGITVGSGIFVNGADFVVTGDATFNSLSRGGTGENGGLANEGGISITGQNSNDFRILGVTQILSQAFGGDVSDLNAGFAGGNAETTLSSLFFVDSNVDLDVTLFRVEATGGAGGLVEPTAQGGNTIGVSGGADVGINNSNVIFRSGLTLESIAIAGSGFSGGIAESPSASFDASNGASVTVDGDLNVTTFAEGGEAFGLSFDDAANGGAGAFAGGIGGNASTQNAAMTFRAPVTVTGAVTVSSDSAGGDAADGNAGSANTGLTEVFTGNGGVLTATSLSLLSSALGGSVQSGGVGNGGEGTSLGANINFDNFDFTIGARNPNSISTLNANVEVTSQAFGGDGGGQGGNGGSANAGFVSLVGTGEGLFTINGNIALDALATGGLSALGLGGGAFAQGAQLISNSFEDPQTLDLVLGTDFDINGNLTFGAITTGGSGQTGGNATGPTLQVFVRNAAVDVSQNLGFVSRVEGGAALASDTPGAGGSATGGEVRITAQSQEGDPVSTLVSMDSLTVTALDTGGRGGDGLSGADGGQGGDAVGTQSFILGRAFDGTITVRNSALLNFFATGGAGGDGVNGGAGGDGFGGGSQTGTASGSLPVTGPVINGAANFNSLQISNSGVGGAGGAGTTGTGGRGGDGQGGFVGLLSRGAPVNAPFVSITTGGFGGAGGAGAIQGDGGDGVAGFASVELTQAFQNPGLGSSDIGTLTVRSRSQGGVGATDGRSYYATGGRFFLRSTVVDIDTIDIELSGADFPDFLVDGGMGGQVPVTVDPFAFTLENALLNTGTVDVVTPGEVSLTLDDSNILADTFRIIAGGFVFLAPDPNAPPSIAGLIDATQLITLEATSGDVATEANLSAGTEIELRAGGGISTGDLSAPSIILDAGNGTIATGSVTTGGGTITLETIDNLDLGAAFASVEAQSINARSVTGDVFSTVALTVVGDLVVDAAGSITLDDVTASSFTATAQGGGIRTGDLTVAGGVTLDAVGSIIVDRIGAAGAIIRSAVGIFAANDAIVMPLGLLDIEVAGSVSLGDVTAGVFDVEATGGGITSTGIINVANGFTAVAGGDIQIGDATTGVLTATSQNGAITAGSLTASNGLVSLTARDTVSVANVDANDLTARSSDGGFINAGTINLNSSVVDIITEQSIELGGVFADTIMATSLAGDITSTANIVLLEDFTATAAGSIALSDLIARSVTANAQGGDLTTGALTANGVNIDLDAAGLIDLASVSGSVFDALAGGDIVIAGNTTLLASFTADAGGAIDIGDVSAASFSAIAAGGGVDAGIINTSGNGDVLIDAFGSVTLTDVFGDFITIDARNGGDLLVAMDLEATNDVNIQVDGSATVGDVSADFIDIFANGGGITVNALNGGLITLDAATAISFLSANASELTAISSGGSVIGDADIALTGALTIEAAGFVGLADVGADSISVTSNGGAINAGLLAAAGTIELVSAGDLALLGADAGIFRATSNTGNVTSNGAVEATGAVIIQADQSVTLDDTDGGFIIITAANGQIASGALTSSDVVELQSVGLISLDDVTATRIQANSTGGDVTSTAAINLTDDLLVNAAGLITLSDVTAQNIALSATGGSIATGALNAAGGAVSLDAVTSIDLAGIVANTILARSTSGNIIATNPINLVGALDVQAGGSVLLRDVTAQSILAAALGGDLVTGALSAVDFVNLSAPGSIALQGINANSIIARSAGGDITSGDSIDIAGVFDVEAGGLINLTDVSAQSIIANAQGGDLSAGALSALEGIDLDASGSISFAGITAVQFNANAASGGITGSGPIVVDQDTVLQADGSITAGDITSNALTASTQGGALTLGTLTVPGALSLLSLVSISLDRVDTNSINAVSTGGDITVVDPIMVIGDVTFDAAGNVTLADVMAQAITLRAGGGAVATGALNAAGAISLESAGSINLDNADGSSIFARSSAGDITGNTAIDIAGALDLGAGGAITLGDVNASAITAAALSGDLTAGALNAAGGLIDLSAFGSLLVASAIGSALNAQTNEGDFEITGNTTLTGALDVDAGRNLTLGNVRASAMAADALNGALLAGALDIAGGPATLNALNAIQVGGLMGGSLSITSAMSNVTSLGNLVVDTDLSITAGGAIAVQDVEAANIVANAQGGGLVTQALTAADLIQLNATGSVSVQDTVANTFTAVSTGGDITLAGSGTLTGNLSANAGGSVTLGTIAAQNVNANTSTGSILSGAIAAAEVVSLNAADAIALNGVNAEALTLQTATGDITSAGVIELTNAMLAVAGGSIALNTVNASAITLQALTGEVSTGALTAMGLVDLNAFATVSTDDIVAGSLVAQSEDSNIEAGDITLIGALSAQAGGSIELGEAAASEITLEASGGDIVAGDLRAPMGLIDLNAFGSLIVGNILGGALDADTEDGDIESGDVAVAGSLDVEAGGSASLGDVDAGSVGVRALGGSVQAGAVNAAQGQISFDASASISLGALSGGSLQARATSGDILIGGPSQVMGLFDAVAGQSVQFGAVQAGAVVARALAGNFTGTGPITTPGNATIEAGGTLNLGRVSARQLRTRSVGATSVRGDWTADLIEVAASLLEFVDDNELVAGPDGVITLISSNAQGVVIGDPGELGEMGAPGDPVPFTLDESNLGLIRASDVNVISTAGNEASGAVQVGALDFGAAAGVDTLRVSADGPEGVIEVIGAVTGGGELGPDALVFSSDRFELDTDTGRIELAPGSELSIIADTILVGTGDLIAVTTGDEDAEDLIEAFNAPVTQVDAEAGEPALVADTIRLEGGSAVLIQNSGTQEAPAGFLVNGVEGIALGAREGAQPLFVINGQLRADSEITTGQDAATAVLAEIEDPSDFNLQSQINGCGLGGCEAIENGGDVTADVSAQVNGVVDAGSSSSTGAAASAGGDTSGSSANSSGETSSGGDTSGGDSGGDSSDGGDESAEDSGEAAGAASAAATASGSDSGQGGGTTPDTVDAGDGSDDFNLDDGNDGGSSAPASGEDGSSDTSGADDTSSGDGSSDDASSDDSSSDDTSSDEASDSSEESAEESSEESSDEDTESAEEEAESEETEEEAEEEAEEEEAAEEEEDTEGPTTGPISAPPSLINENTLNRNTVIDNPISGNGNPALLDPDIATPAVPAEPASSPQSVPETGDQ